MDRGANIGQGMTMIWPWAMEEMKKAELEDKRLNNRLKLILGQLVVIPRQAFRLLAQDMPR